MVDLEELKECNRYPVVFAARNRDDVVRCNSTSGGMYQALASYVIEELNGVVYGCAFDDKLHAIHIRCEDMVEAERCMGSKYSQSDMRDSVRLVCEDLKAGRTVLFTGTPCQVAAVRAVSANIRGHLLAVDVICHGVPSPNVFQGWLAEMERARGARVVAYEHRPKTFGWQQHFERVTWEDGRIEQNTRYTETWKRLFFDDKMLRPSCYRCPYTVAYSRPGDLTIADFWGIETTSHVQPNDQALGVSLVLANDEVGLSILSELNIEYEIASLAEALPGNPMLEHPSSYIGDRDEPWNDLYAGGMLSMVKSEHYLVSSIHFTLSRIKRALKYIFGR